MGHVGVVILAAGESSRLGQPKQLALFRGRPLIEHAIASALGSDCRPVVVVLGANADLIKANISRDVRVVINPDWQEGMASSIRCGIDAIESEIDAVMLMVCDQPLISGAILNEIASRADAKLVAAEYKGTIGVPALFGRDFFSKLKALRGKEGAKKILLANEASVMRIACPEASIDVDTADDLRKLQSYE